MHDGQAQSGAVRAGGEEAHECAGALVGGHAGAVVGDDQLGAALRRGHGDGDPAAFVQRLGRVGQQVVQDLLQVPGAHRDHGRRHVRRLGRLHQQFHARAVGDRVPGGYSLGGGGDHVDHDPLLGDGLGAGRRQQPVHQPGQPGDLALCPGKLGRRSRTGVGGQQVDPQPQRGQRCPELV